MNLSSFITRCPRGRDRLARAAVLLGLTLLHTTTGAEAGVGDAGAAARDEAPARAGPAPRCADGAAPFARVELFFGLSRPEGVVTNAEFQAFVDAHVTPRFPDGLTILTGAGQFRDARGRIVAERAKLLILLVPAHDEHVDAHVEAIRSRYRRQFDQQSVLRADTSTCVSF